MESLPQQISKEMVIAVPAPFVIQWEDEKIGAFDGFQGCLTGTNRGQQDGITQVAAQAIEDGRAK